MTIKNIFSDCLFKFIDPCKNCESYRFTCKRCINNEFYRHIDDKKKMKSNLKTIRSRGLSI